MSTESLGLGRQASLGYQVNRLARLLAGSLRARIEPHGVVPGQFAQLLALYDEDGITQNELCERVHVDQSTMAHTLKRMERDGLINRSADPTDRRRAIIRLTSRARSLQPILTAAAVEVNAVATRGVDSAEADAAMSVVARLIDNLAGDAPLAGAE